MKISSRQVHGFYLTSKLLLTQASHGTSVCCLPFVFEEAPVNLRHLTSPPRERDHCDKASTQPADVWVCRWGVALCYDDICSSQCSHTGVLLRHWCGVSCWDINTHPVLFWVHDWCGQCPDPSLSHPVRHYRDRITTVPALKPPVWACKSRQSYFILREPWRAKCMPL